MRIGIDYTVGIYQGSGVGRYTRTLVHALAASEREIDFTLLWARARGGDGKELPKLDSMCRNSATSVGSSKSTKVRSCRW